MRNQIKRALKQIWNCRATLPLQCKVKVRAVQALEEMKGNKMTQDKTLEFIIDKYKS